MTSPDPRYLYFSSQVKEALAKCEFMARDRIGPIYMYGPIGSGKTSLVRRLQEKLGQDERYNVKLLISLNLKSSNAFLRLILETFDVKTERSYTASLKNFEEFLLRQFKEGKIPVLLIDEAQYMTRDTLKLIKKQLNEPKKSTKPQTHLPTNQFSTLIDPLERPEKYTTHLEPSLVKKLKLHAAKRDMKDYQVMKKRSFSTLRKWRIQNNRP